MPTQIFMFNEELDGDWLIILAGEFWTRFSLRILLADWSSDGVVERRGGAGDLIGNSKGCLLCGCCFCCVSELDESFLLNPFDSLLEVEIRFNI